MNPSTTLYIHGKALSLVREDPGAVVLEMSVDQSHDRDRVVRHLQNGPTLRFFWADGDIWRGDELWVQVELLADWQDITKSPDEKKWIRPLSQEPDKYDYSLAGELFHYPVESRSPDEYVDVGFPVSLSLSKPPYSVRKKFAEMLKRGSFIQVSNGQLYGHLELDDPELKPNWSRAKV